MTHGESTTAANPTRPRPWRLAVDTGGTFTDGLAVDPCGRRHRVKVLSTSALRGRIARRLRPDRVAIEGAWDVPDGFFRGFELRVLGSGIAARVVDSEASDRAVRTAGPLPDDPAIVGAAVELQSPEEAPVLLARLVTGTPAGRALPAMELRLATTLGTNALLERRGARTLLVITRGFRDLLAIGNQQRPDLFAIDVRKPAPLPAAVVEVDERLAADGSVLRPLDLETLDAALDALDVRVDAAAVALLHSYRNPEHERRVAERLERRGLRHVSRSSDLAPLIKILPRAETAVVDAYLAPIVGGYLERVTAAVPGRRVLAMTSAGGLVGAAAFRPKDSLLSGPAGGVVGAARAAAVSGVRRLLGFDMGGTSTDVARYDGAFEHRFETRVGDARLFAPALAIESVAAGGGSVCRFDGRRLTVGPDSAGARPGPACYGAGGPLTLTDVNLLLGRLAPERFGIPIDAEASERRLADLLAELGTGDRERILDGLLRIADERMAEAIRRISVRRGYRAADHTLVAFGGAGGQHACAVAEILGIETVLVPVDAGLLSALGVAYARLERFAQRQVLRPLEEVGCDGVRAVLRALETEARAALGEDGIDGDAAEIALQRTDLRWRGQEDTLALDAEPVETLAARFEARYEEVFGYVPPQGAVEIEAVRVVAASREPALAPGRGRDAHVAEPVRRGGALDVLDREDLDPGARFSGPALVAERHAATYLPRGWIGAVDAARALVLRRTGDA